MRKPFGAEVCQLRGLPIRATPSTSSRSLRPLYLPDDAEHVGVHLLHPLVVQLAQAGHRRFGGGGHQPRRDGLAAFACARRANWPYLLALGTLALGIPYFLFFQGLKRIRAQTVSIVALLEPVTGVLIGTLLYREIPSVAGWIGIALILASIVLISRK